MSKQIVEQVKAELVARGQRWNTNEDALQITGRVAWILRDQGAMLITKSPSQNHATTSTGYLVSPDAIAFPTGWIDCLVSAGPELNLNEPAWAPTNSSNAMLIPPYDMDLAALPTVVPPTAPAAPVEPSEPVPTPVVAGGIEARLQAIEDLLTHLSMAVFDLGVAAAPAPTVFPTYETPYDIKAPWPIGTLKGTITSTPRKR